MIRVLYRHQSGTIIEDFPLAQLPSAVRDTHSRVWIDMQAPTDIEYQQILHDTFTFHPLAIEDTVNESHVPKVDNYGAYLYLVFHTLQLGGERMDIDTFEIDAFLGSNYLITIHGHISENINRLWDAEYHRHQGLLRGVAFVLYEIIDKQIDSYIPLLDQFEQRVEEIGDVIFQKPKLDENALLDEILTAKTSALRMRRILLPQRELIKRLAQNDYAAIPAEARIYFNDLYDHLVRLSELVESMRDLVNSTTTTYLTIASNRLNEVMKVLTIISTIFMPLGFLAAVYGMNFSYMPELDWPWAYALIWVLFLTIGGIMLVFFRRRGWLQ